MQAPSQAILKALTRYGLLLKQDKRLPSVVTMLTGAPLTSSWWSHPDAHRIFRVLCGLADHPDVLVAKLLYRKDTFVHRSLWPALLGAVGANERWQRQRLSQPAKRLLARVHRQRTPVTSGGTATGELLARLLVHAEEVHTVAGRHQIAARSWQRWAADAGVEPMSPPHQARATLEAAAAGLGAPRAALPWPLPR